MRKLGRIITFVFIMMTAVPFASAERVEIGKVQVSSQEDSYIIFNIIDDSLDVFTFEWALNLVLDESGEFCTGPLIIESSGSIAMKDGAIENGTWSLKYEDEEIYDGEVTDLWPWPDDYGQTNILQTCAFPFPLWVEGHGYVNLHSESLGDMKLYLGDPEVPSSDPSLGMRGDFDSCSFIPPSWKYKITLIDGQLDVLDKSKIPKPKLVLDGEESVEQTWGTELVDPGAHVEGFNKWADTSQCFTIDKTYQFKAIGSDAFVDVDSLDVNTAGEYEIAYTASGTDIAGNPVDSNTITRTVRVTDDGPIPAGGGDGDGGDGGGGGGGGDCFISTVR